MAFGHVWQRVHLTLDGMDQTKFHTKNIIPLGHGLPQTVSYLERGHTHSTSDPFFGQVCKDDLDVVPKRWAVGLTKFERAWVRMAMRSLQGYIPKERAWAHNGYSMQPQAGSSRLGEGLTKFERAWVRLAMRSLQGYIPKARALRCNGHLSEASW